MFMKDHFWITWY